MSAATATAVCARCRSRFRPVVRDGLCKLCAPVPVAADGLAVEARMVYGHGVHHGTSDGDIGTFADNYASLLKFREICDPATGEPYTAADVKGWLA